MPLLLGGYLFFMGFMIGFFFYTILNIPYFFRPRDLLFYFISILLLVLLLIFFFAFFYYTIKFHKSIGKEKFIKFFKWHFSDYDYTIKMQLSVFWIVMYEFFISILIEFILCPESCVTNSNMIYFFSYGMLIVIPDLIILYYASRISDKIKE